MRSNEAFTITLPAELAQLVRAKVASGEYASESDVIEDGLRSLAEQDAAPDDPVLERWLRQEVVPTLEALDADPARAVSLEEAQRRLHAHIDRLVGQRPTGA